MVLNRLAGNRKQSLKKSKKLGASLVSVITVLMVAIVMLGTLSLVATMSLTNSRNKVNSEKDKIYARSINDAIVKQLLLTNYKVHPLITKLVDGPKKSYTTTVSMENAPDAKVTIKYGETKKNIVISTKVGKGGASVEFTQKKVSQTVVNMEGVYTNAFYMQGGSSWGVGTNVEGKVFIAASGNSTSDWNMTANQNGDVESNGNVNITGTGVITGNIKVNGDLTINSDITVIGNITCNGTLNVYGKVVASDVDNPPTIHANETAQFYSKTQIQANVIAKDGINIHNRDCTFLGKGITQENKITSGVGQSNAECNAKFAKGVEWKKVEDLKVQESQLPVFYPTEDWGYVYPLDDKKVKPFTDNLINKSGYYSTQNLLTASDLIFDTTQGDLYVHFEGQYSDSFTFSRNMVVRGENRVFFFCEFDTMNFNGGKGTGHIGKIEGLADEVTPYEGKFFLINTRPNYSIIHLNDGVRLDGYIYAKNTQVSAKGLGIKGYKIVGGIVAKVSSVKSDDMVLYAMPNLVDVIFKEETETIYVDRWGISKYF